jgi:hypothetical protein
MMSSGATSRNLPDGWSSSGESLWEGPDGQSVNVARHEIPDGERVEACHVVDRAIRELESRPEIELSPVTREAIEGGERIEYRAVIEGVAAHIVQYVLVGDRTLSIITGTVDGGEAGDVHLAEVENVMRSLV